MGALDSPAMPAEPDESEAYGAGGPRQERVQAETGAELAQAEEEARAQARRRALRRRQRSRRGTVHVNRPGVTARGAGNRPSRRRLLGG